MRVVASTISTRSGDDVISARVTLQCRASGTASVSLVDFGLPPESPEPLDSRVREESGSQESESTMTLSTYTAPKIST